MEANGGGRVSPLSSLIMSWCRAPGYSSELWEQGRSRAVSPGGNEASVIVLHGLMATVAETLIPQTYFPCRTYISNLRTYIPVSCVWNIPKMHIMGLSGV